MTRGKTKEIDYEKDITIDKHSLDREFTKHPLLHMKYASMAVRAEKEAKRAHENLKRHTTKSQLMIYPRLLLPSYLSSPSSRWV